MRINFAAVYQLKTDRKSCLLFFSDKGQGFYHMCRTLPLQNVSVLCQDPYLLRFAFSTNPSGALRCAPDDCVAKNDDKRKFGGSPKVAVGLGRERNNALTSLSTKLFIC